MRAEGKLKWPSLSLTTVMVMVDPVFCALTSTPSIAPSASDLTCPVRFAACAESDPANRPARPATSAGEKRVRMETSPDFLIISLVERLELDDGRAVIAASPEGRQRSRVVHEHA